MSSAPCTPSFESPHHLRHSFGGSKVRPCPEHAKSHDHLLGVSIEMYFDGLGMFSGVVRDIDLDACTKEPLYRVQYEDGDEEHLTRSQVMSARPGRQSMPLHLKGDGQKPLPLGSLFAQQPSSTPSPARQTSVAQQLLFMPSPARQPSVSGRRLSASSPLHGSLSSTGDGNTNVMAPRSPTALVPYQSAPVWHQQQNEENGGNKQTLRSGGIICAVVMAFLVGYRVSKTPSSFYGSVVPTPFRATIPQAFEHAQSAVLPVPLDENLKMSGTWAQPDDALKMSGESATVDPLMELRQQVSQQLHRPVAAMASAPMYADPSEGMSPGQHGYRNPEAQKAFEVDAVPRSRPASKLQPQPQQMVWRPEVAAWVARGVGTQPSQPTDTHTVIQQVQHVEEAEKSSAMSLPSIPINNDPLVLEPRLGVGKAPAAESWKETKASAVESRRESKVENTEITRSQCTWHDIILAKLPLLTLVAIVVIFRHAIVRVFLGPQAPYDPYFASPSPIAPASPVATEPKISHFAPGMHSSLPTASPASANSMPSYGATIVAVKREPPSPTSHQPSRTSKISSAQREMRNGEMPREVEGLLKHAMMDDHGQNRVTEVKAAMHRNGGRVSDALMEVNLNGRHRFRHMSSLEEIRKMGYGHGDQEETIKQLLTKHARTTKDPKALAQQALNEYWEICQK